MQEQAKSGEQIVQDVIDSGPVSLLQIKVVLLCFLFNVLDGFDITAMAVVANHVALDLHLKPGELGWIFSCSLAGMMFGAMFLAPLSDVIGRQKLIVLSLLLVGFSVLFTAYANSLVTFIVLRFLAGIGAGAMLATQATLAAEYSQTRYRALTVALVTAGYPTGAMFTAVMASWIMPYHGWAGMFVFGGVVTVFMTIVARMALPESLKFLLQKPLSGPAETPSRLAQINQLLSKLRRPHLTCLPSVKVNKNPYGIVQGIQLLVSSEHRATTFKLWWSFLLCFITLYFLLSWTPKLVEDSGFSEESGRQAFFLLNLGGMIGIFVVGLLSTRWMLSKAIFVLMLGAALSQLIYAMLPLNQLNIMLSIIFIIGLLQQGGFTGLYSAAAKAYPTAIRSTGIGWAIGLGRLGAVIGPALAGYLLSFGLAIPNLFMIFAIPMFLASVLALSLNLR